MAVWKCAKCEEVFEGRCKPKQCKKCGASKDELIKQ